MISNSLRRGSVRPASARANARITRAAVRVAATAGITVLTAALLATDERDQPAQPAPSTNLDLVGVSGQAGPPVPASVACSKLTEWCSARQVP